MIRLNVKRGRGIAIEATRGLGGDLAPGDVRGTPAVFAPPFVTYLKVQPVSTGEPAVYGAGTGDGAPDAGNAQW